ncbi:MAG: winged helix DNA-binding protein, partial [Candidatus Methanoplasma sp.]|nr:winged helix DNA-binding protein [Candidatus Methanoplasma sp.]
MYSRTELLLLHHIGKGAVSIIDLHMAMGLSNVQIYRTVASLEGKGAVRFENGEVTVREQTHLYTLMNILHDSVSAVDLLAGNGLDIIREMREPATAREVSERLGISQRTVSRSIKRMRNVGMLSKDGDRYRINAKMWPELLPLADRYADYSESFDERVPPGSRIYHRSRVLTVFSNDRDLEYTKTAFSRFKEFGISIHLDTQYYCNLADPLTVGDIMFHCLEVISIEKNWRLRMLSLMFYKKYRNELGNINHPMKEEMEQVLMTREGKVDGWVPLSE